MSNKNKLYVLLSAGIMMVAPLSSHAQSDTPFVSLFNGTDITGWSLKAATNDLKNFVKIQNGNICIESSGGNGWLWLYSDSEYTDFVLKLKFTAPSGDYGNSGVNFRSRFDPNDQGGYLNGPQVDIYPRDNWRTGLILDMTRGNERWLKPDLKDWNITKQPTPTGWKFYYDPEWNDLEIRVTGMNVTTIVNGGTYVDKWDGTTALTDQVHKNKNVGEKGFLALQAHSDQKVKIFFKDIIIQDLTRDPPVPVSHLPSKITSLDINNSSVQTYSINGKKTVLNKNIRENDLRPGLYILKKGSISRLKAVVR